MKIAVDIDEVLADFATPLVKYIKKKYNLKTDQDKWNTSEWWQAWGGTKITAVAKIMSFLNSSEFGQLKPIPGAKEGVKELNKLGHELVVITGRPVEIMDKTKKWINQHFPKQFRRIYSTDFHLAKGGDRTKGAICAEIGGQVLLDDFPEYARECVENDIRVILFTTFYNEYYHVELPGMTRAKDWPDVVSQIKRLDAGLNQDIKTKTKS